jgi:hypothetical protein
MIECVSLAFSPLYVLDKSSKSPLNGNLAGRSTGHEQVRDRLQGHRGLQGLLEQTVWELRHLRSSEAGNGSATAW